MSFSWTDFINKGLATFNPSPQIPPANSDAPEAVQAPAQAAATSGTLASSVLSLAGPDGYVDPLAVADYISYTVNTGLAMTASKVFGYNLEFAVHEKGSVLVTGASGRVGAHAARTLASLGLTVFAGVASAGDARRLAAKAQRDASAGRVVPLVLDVTDAASLRAAYAAVCAALGVAADGRRLSAAEKLAAGLALPSQHRSTSRSRLAASVVASNSDEDDEEAIEPLKVNFDKTAVVPPDVRPEDLFIGIINCEGTESPGALEVVPLSEIMRCYEVNTAGAVAVTQCFLPLLRESKGRIINVCSSVGVTAAPINGSYAASKVALIAVSESLRVELYSFGISVSIIEPGSLEAWNPKPKKDSAEPVHSLQLGQSATPTASPTDESQDQSTPLPSMPVVSRSKSRSLLRMSAPPSSLPSLNEDEEATYVAPVKKGITNRRGSGSVDENNRPSSPQVFPYQSGLASPPPSPSPLANSNIPLPSKRRSLSSLSGHYKPPSPTQAAPAAPAQPPKRATTSLSTNSSLRSELTPLLGYKPTNPSALRRASTTDPRLDRARSSTSSLSVNPSVGIHPTWDATDRARVAQKLYGPLMDTVAEVNQATVDRVRESEKGDRDAATQRRKSIGNLSGSGSTASVAGTPDSREDRFMAPAKPRRRAQSVAPTGALQRAVELGVVEPTNTEGDIAAMTSSCRHVSRAIVHSLTSPFPKTRYRVGWDAKTTSVLRWALPDRFLDWGYVAMSGSSSSASSSSATIR